MNPWKKSLLIALTLFVSIDCSSGQARRVKSRLQRPGQQKAQVPESTRKEVEQVFNTDKPQQIKKEVNDVNALATTPQKQQDVKIALQQELIKEAAAIKADLIEVQADQPQYITYEDALEIIKSKKDLANMKRSSWTNSLIIKPFTKTYRLFLRVWNQKEYAKLLEKERRALEHALNVQAHNNLMLLVIALIKPEISGHMFEKYMFYNMTTQAFEGGAILAADMNLSQKTLDLINELEGAQLFYFDRIKPLGPISGRAVLDVEFEALTHINKVNPAIIQSIWSMNQVIKEASHLKSQNAKKYNKKGDDPFKRYDIKKIEKRCIKIAAANNQVLHDNKKSYSQYLKDWISKPQNLAKAGIVMAAIGGLYVYGPAIPEWLKKYTNTTKNLIGRGYNTGISSVKNLWNKVRGNTELPDSQEARTYPLTIELENGSTITKNLKYDDTINYLTDELYQAEPEAILNEHQKAGQQLDGFDTEIRADELEQNLLQQNYEADQAKAQEAAEAQERLFNELEKLERAEAKQFREQEAMIAQQKEQLNHERKRNAYLQSLQAEDTIQQLSEHNDEPAYSKPESYE